VSGRKCLSSLTAEGDAQEPPRFQSNVEKQERDHQRVTRTQGWEAQDGHSFPGEQHSPSHAEVGDHRPWGFLPTRICQQPCGEQEVGVETPQGPVYQPLGDHVRWHGVFLHQITTCRCWAASRAALRSWPRSPAGRSPWRISCPHTSTTCSLPTTIVSSSLPHPWLATGTGHRGLHQPFFAGRNHRLTEWFGLGRNLQRSSSPTQDAGASSARSGCSKPCPTWPRTLAVMGHPQLLWATCSAVLPPWSWKISSCWPT